MIVHDNETFLLPDNRQLGYSKYGDPDGQPVLFFHGIPGSRLQRNPDISIFDDLSICIYALDRPGVGLSTYQKNRTIINWADDVKVFCEGMGLRTYNIIGISSGAPYALVCGLKLVPHVRKLALVSAIGPLYIPELFRLLDKRLQMIFKAAHRFPLLLSFFISILFGIFGLRLRDAFQYFVSHLPPKDHELFTRTEINEMFEKDVAEAFRQGAKGVVNDLFLLSEFWDFSLNNIEIPVNIWHGVEDGTVPLAMAQYFNDNLPCSELHFVEDAGHFFAIEKTREIFASVC